MQKMKKQLIAQTYSTEVINMRINNELKKEIDVQGRIIKSMNETIIELREQLTETEEKYNELLKQISSEK